MLSKSAGRPAGVERKALTAKESAFAQCFVRTGNKSAAFRESYSVGNMNATQVAANANRVYKRPAVQEEIKRLQAVEEELRQDAYRAQMLDEMSQWSRADSLDKLRQVVIAASEAMRTPIENEDGAVVGYSFDASAARVVRDTVETINKMQGYNEPDKSEVEAVISVAFSEGEDFAG